MDIFNEVKVKEDKYISYYKRDDKIISFKCKIPFKYFVFAFLVFVLAVLVIYYSYKYGFQRKAIKIWWAILTMSIGIGLAIIFGIGLHVIFSFRFEFKNGVYIHKGPFKHQKETISLEHIEDVSITRFYTSKKRKYLIIFWSKEGKRCIYFYNNGFVMGGNIFIKSLQDNGIKYELNS